VHSFHDFHSSGLPNDLQSVKNVKEVKRLKQLLFLGQPHHRNGILSTHLQVSVLVKNNLKIGTMKLLNLKSSSIKPHSQPKQ